MPRDRLLATNPQAVKDSWSRVVVERKVLPDRLLGERDRVAGAQTYLLVLDRFPRPFDERVGLCHSCCWSSKPDFRDGQGLKRGFSSLGASFDAKKLGKRPAAFTYFLQAVNPANGLMPTTPGPRPASGRISTVTISCARGRCSSTSSLAGTFHHNATLRRRNALLTTDTELRLIANAATIGDSVMPSTGYSTPAASGTPTAL